NRRCTANRFREVVQMNQLNRRIVSTAGISAAMALFLLTAPVHGQTTSTGKSGSAASRPAALAADTNADSVRSFRISVPDEALADLKRRIAATRWPEAETVSDQSQGVQLAKLQALVRYWGSDYDWRRAEAALNALPQF